MVDHVNLGGVTRSVILVELGVAVRAPELEDLPEENVRQGTAREQARVHTVIPWHCRPATLRELAQNNELDARLVRVGRGDESVSNAVRLGASVPVTRANGSMCI